MCVVVRQEIDVIFAPQLFAVMNNILVSDSSCGQRELSLKTYQVIPMTPRYL